jgi:hypothetical protein
MQMLQVGRVQKMARSEPENLPLNKEAAAVLTKATVGAKTQQHPLG